MGSKTELGGIFVDVQSTPLDRLQNRSTIRELRHSAAGMRYSPRRPLERVDAQGKARELTGYGVPVQHPLGDRAMQLWLGQMKGGSRRLLVAAGDCGLDLFDESAHPAGAGPIDCRALDGLPVTFLSGFMRSHAGLP